MTGTASEASAPASSANLGPGFDCLALALEIRCKVRAWRSEQWKVRHVGRHRPPPESADAVLAGARAAVGPEHPLRLEVDNHVPIGSGLGSSAAAYAAGAAAAFRSVGQPVDPNRIFRLVTSLEGHPDNAAATAFGGLVLVDPGSRVLKLTMSDAYGLLVLVPAFRLFTSESRSVVPERFELPAVVNSLSRMAALVAGLTSGEAGILRSALGDELHESSRNRLRPMVGELIGEALSAGAVYAAWSGSGPSVLVFTKSSEAGQVAEALSSSLGDQVEIACPPIASRGIV
ncbi:MAG: homoserine kinase [bacterium]|nr:homoserine kinase [bacterium]MDE0235500.1 homoserine kinase [bacterium]